MSRLDRIYITASRHDGRYSRICAASVRYFYPDAPVSLLPGGTLEPGLAEEMARYWNIGLAAVEERDWGWGFVKLEPLFGPAGERFMVLDSDTAFGGLVLSAWEDSAADFLVDDEQQDEADTRRLYYDWREVAKFDPEARAPAFVFNSGQWFGTSGVLSRADFEPWVNWDAPKPALRHADCFMPGDQGVLNYVLNQKAALQGLAVDRKQIMRWPGHGMSDFSAAAVRARTAPARVIHWAGMKKPRLGAMTGADLLRFFESYYYSRTPGGSARRRLAGLGYPLETWRRGLSERARLRLGRIVGS